MDKNQTPNGKRYDLEDRTRLFAESCRDVAFQFPFNSLVLEDLKQLVRSSGSVAANYLESRESLSKKDSIYRLKICRKEAKESHMWLNMLRVRAESRLLGTLQKLIQESRELVLIFNSIVTKLSNN